MNLLEQLKTWTSENFWDKLLGFLPNLFGRHSHTRRRLLAGKARGETAYKRPDGKKALIRPSTLLSAT